MVNSIPFTHSLHPPSLLHTHPAHPHTAPTPVKAIQHRAISEGYGGGGATPDIWDQGKLGWIVQVPSIIHSTMYRVYNIMCMNLQYLILTAIGYLL